jgi:hypothetical protein
VQRARTTMSGLLAIIAIASCVTLPGCTEDIQETVISDVRNQSFTFASGAVFHPALASMSTTLSLLDNPSSFALSSATGRASGLITFTPCVLTLTSSTYAPGAGPQAHDELRLVPCDYDASNNTLLIGNGTTTALSAPGVPL